MFRKIGQWVCFLVCIALFLAFRFHAFSRKPSPIVYANKKPLLPAPITITQENSWLKRQPFVKDAALEIVRDLSRIRHFNTYFPDLTQEVLIAQLMERLLVLQAAIPFTFPNTLYSVLFITDTAVEGPFPFHVLKRLYLGETALGFPFYLDVREFDLEKHNSEEIIAWHLDILDGPCEELSATKARKTYLCRGMRTAQQNDRTHGFAGFQGERALFLDIVEQNDRLYVCYAEAPIATFNQHIASLLKVK